MAAGTKYNLKSEETQVEIYRADTAVRKSGPWNWDMTNLTEGASHPSFTPVYADLKKRTLTPVRNVEVAEAYATSGSNTTLKVKKNSLVYQGMHIGDGKKGATVNAIDKSNEQFDILTISADLGVALKVGDVLFEATTAAGSTKKNTANFVTYNHGKFGALEHPTLLMQAYEIKIPKLPLPIHQLDKEGLTDRFQFEY